MAGYDSPTMRDDDLPLIYPLGKPNEAFWARRSDLAALELKGLLNVNPNGTFRLSDLGRQVGAQINRERGKA